jgi:hypothetical protein
MKIPYVSLFIILFLNEIRISYQCIVIIPLPPSTTTTTTSTSTTTSTTSISTRPTSTLAQSSTSVEQDTSEAPNQEECGKPEVEPGKFTRIINGNEAIQNSWPVSSNQNMSTEHYEHERKFNAMTK